jgi:hypothetical protein
MALDVLGPMTCSSD